MTHVLHAGLLVGCRKNCRPRPDRLIAESLPCGAVSAGWGTLRLVSQGRGSARRGARRDQLCGPSSGR